MHNQSEKKSDAPEKVVTVRKRDLEMAIKEGLISVEVGTSLWRTWRNKPQPEIKSLSIKYLFSLVSEQYLLRLLCYVVFGIGILSSFVLTWGYGGLLSVAVISMIYACLLFLLCKKVSQTNRILEQLLLIFGINTLLCFAVYAVSIYFDVRLMSPRPKVDVFGVVPSDNSGQIMVFSFISALSLRYLSGFFNSRLPLLFSVVSAVLCFDSTVCWFLDHAVSVPVAKLISTFITAGAICTYVYFRRKNTSSHTALKFVTNEVVALALVTLVAYYSQSIRFGNLILFVASSVVFITSIGKQWCVAKFCALLGLVLSVVGVIWPLLGSLRGTLLIASVGALLLVYIEHVAGVESFLRSLFNKYFIR